MNKTVCEKCNRMFGYTVTSMNVPGGKDKEFIYCPYCNQKNGWVITSGFVYSHKINDQKNNSITFVESNLM